MKGLVEFADAASGQWQPCRQSEGATRRYRLGLGVARRKGRSRSL